MKFSSSRASFDWHALRARRNLLNLSHHPSIGPNRTLFWGWRQLLLSLLLTTSESHRLDRPIVSVAEDDVRLCNVSPGRIREVCSMVLDANPDLHILFVRMPP